MQNNPYQSLLNLKDTEKAIKIVKDTFEMHLAKNLHLLRVSAPLLVHPSTGLNDDLNGVERPVIFDVKEDEAPVSVVQSLAKWKRYALKRYQFKMHQGLYTDMNAIRRDEALDALHSVYVDQWDWEKIIHIKERNLSYLKKIVTKIYHSLTNAKKDPSNLSTIIFFFTSRNSFYHDTRIRKSLSFFITKRKRISNLQTISSCFFNANWATIESFKKTP